MKTSIQGDSKSQSSTFALGLSLVSQGRYGPALTVLRLCLEESGRSGVKQLGEIHDTMGVCLDGLRMPVEASKHFEKAKALQVGILS